MNKIPFNIDLWKSGRYDVVFRGESIPVKDIINARHDCIYGILSVSESNEILTHTDSGLYLDGSENISDIMLVEKYPMPKIVFRNVYKSNHVEVFNFEKLESCKLVAHGAICIIRIINDSQVEIVHTYDI